MDAQSDTVLHKDILTDAFPSTLTEGSKSKILIAGPTEPAQYGIILKALCQHGTEHDTALLVATTESVEQTLDTYRSLCPDPDRPALHIVDTASEQQSISAPYQDTPVEFIPSPADLERLEMALSTLAETSSQDQAQHLLIRSLSPILKHAPSARVCTFLDRIAAFQTGLGLFGINYTAHDKETMTALTNVVDGILWVTETTEHLEFEFHVTNRPYQFHEL